MAIPKNRGNGRPAPGNSPTGAAGQSSSSSKKRAFFLPFTANGAATERQAIEVKSALNVAAGAIVDPFEVLGSIPARLLSEVELRRLLPREVYEILFSTGVGAWSAIGWGRSPSTGEDLILVNPSHHPHRQRVSLMEEIVHIILDHPKVSLIVDKNGRLERTHDQRIEDEAFGVGAACIIPYPALFAAVNDRAESSVTIAARYQVSVDYVTYRIKRAGLTNVYRKRQQSL
jgi:hypothetical protein